jgi:hypothetical protein
MPSNIEATIASLVNSTRGVVGSAQADLKYRPNPRKGAIPR